MNVQIMLRMKRPAKAQVAQNPQSAIVIQTWPYRLTVRTEPSQGSNTGSIPVKATQPFSWRYLPPWTITQTTSLSLASSLPHLWFFPF